MVKISEAINISFNILKQSVQSARCEAELLTAYVLKKDRLYLALHKDEPMDDVNLGILKNISAQRADAKPLSYITGTKEFMSLEFNVNENVLIPRPETEELVQLVIDLCTEFKDRDLKIIDLCTGSGAICCSLAYYLKNAFCLGVDISKDAIDTAKGNAEKLGVSERTDFIVSDVLKPLDFEDKFDIVVSNPPYIESDVIKYLDDTVKNYEPHLALDGGGDGLDFYREIIKNIDSLLKKKGMLYFEIGYNQGEALKKLLEEKFYNIKIIKDLSGHDRIAFSQLA